MKVIPIKAQAGITGFDPLSAEYTELKMSLHDINIH